MTYWKTRPFESKKSKKLYFQRKYKEKHIFPLIIEYFLLYLQRNSTKCILHYDHRTRKGTT